MDERGQGYRQLKVQCPVLFHGAFTIQWQFYSRLQKDGLGLRLWSMTLLADIFGADKGFFRVWVAPTLPCPGQGPVAKGWRFFPCLTVLWQLSEWIGDLVIESWPICDLRHFSLFRRHHRELLCGHDRQKDKDKTLIYSTLMLKLTLAVFLWQRYRQLRQLKFREINCTVYSLVFLYQINRLFSKGVHSDL